MRIWLCTYPLLYLDLGPLYRFFDLSSIHASFALRYIAALHSLHSDCGITAFWCRNFLTLVSEHFNLECGELRQKVLDILAPQRNASMNKLLVKVPDSAAFLDRTKWSYCVLVFWQQGFSQKEHCKSGNSRATLFFALFAQFGLAQN